MSQIALFWFRRDLRLEDNAGLYHALKSGLPVLPVFIFDRQILDPLPVTDARVTFIHQVIQDLQESLQQMGSTLHVFYGTPMQAFEYWMKHFRVKAVFTNRDYEPYALERDQVVQDYLQENQVEWHPFKDHVIFEKDEILKDDGTPYVVFTPYSRKWLARLQDNAENVQKGSDSKPEDSYFFQSYPSEDFFDRFAKMDPKAIPSLSEMGFERAEMDFPPKTVKSGIIRNYDQTRNFPALEEGTSRLGIHFRFGTISIREKARKAAVLNKTFLNELIWRDFYAMILAHFPHTATGPFRKEYERIEWRNKEDEFQAWCEGKTGYPLVDAGMRQLNQTGYMHNRVRMVTASFLTKHLLINWQWGEAYFAEKLLDFDLSSNNGGWQWAAGCGTDAAPYFRIFNPESQLQKFDRDKKYVKTWVPEYGTRDYPAPMVDHSMARERCLKVYKEALSD